MGVSTLLYIGLRYLFNYLNKPEKSISILAWIGTFSPYTIQQFEEKTGIRVKISYYTTNEELISKMHLTEGEGVDIIVPSDYALSYLRETNMIASLEKNKITDYAQIFPFLLAEENENSNVIHSIPLEWGIYGIAYHDDLSNELQNPTDFMEAFFTGILQNKIYRLSSSNDILAAANMMWNYYLYRFSNPISHKDEVNKILYELFKKQSHSIKTFSDSNIGYLFSSHMIDMASIQSDEFMRCRMDDEYNKNHLRFFIPEGKITKTIEYIAVSSKSKNINECYEFINFFTNKETLKDNIKRMGYFPIRHDLLNTEILDPMMYDIINKVIKRKRDLYSINPFLNDYELVALWMKIKS